MDRFQKNFSKVSSFLFRKFGKQNIIEQLEQEIFSEKSVSECDSTNFYSEILKYEDPAVSEGDSGCGTHSDHSSSSCKDLELDENKPVVKSRKRLDPVTPQFSLCEQRILEAWGKLMSDELLLKIVQHTNEEVRQKLLIVEGEPNKCEISLNEFKAYLGLLYISGLENVAQRKPKELWSKQYGPTIFRATMNLQRFSFIGSCLRFESRNALFEGKKCDKFAPIRDIWESFNYNCAQSYPPSEYCEIVDYRLEFKSRGPFRIKGTNDQSVHGIKFGLMNDIRTDYLVGVTPYIPDETSKFYETEDEYYIRKLCTPRHNTRKNHKKYLKNSFAPMCERFSTSRPTNRWFEQVFYSILDYAIMNAAILYHMNTKNPQVERDRFIRKLSIALLKSFLPVPYESANRLSPHVKQQMKQIMDGCPPQEEIKGLTCYKVEPEKRSTIQRCFICAENVCATHDRGFCPRCCDLL